MAALLLPRRIVAESVRSKLAAGGFKTAEDCIHSGQGLKLIQTLADEFDVSQTATLYRLQSLGFIPQGEQMEMQLKD